MKSSHIVSIVLVLAIGGAVAMVPWSNLGRPTKSAVKQRLEERFAQYRQLRLANDWNALYDMTVSSHRDKVDRSKFLEAYGHGVLIARSIEILDYGFVEQLDSGATKFEIEVELVPSKLPIQQRRSLQVNSPESLRSKDTVEINWRRIGGEWYFLMDPEIVSGQVDGKPIQAGLGGEQAGGAPR